MIPDLEQRFLPKALALPTVEVRAEDAAPVFTGMAPPWDSWSEDLGFRERFMPGAFAEVLADPALDCVANWQHDSDFPLGRTTNGTLVCQETARGMEWRSTPIWPSERVNDYVKQVAGGYVAGSSFAFTQNDVKGEVWALDGEELTRTILRVTGLFDVAIVTHPAYSKSEVGLRRRDAWAAANLTAREVARIHERDADRAADKARRASPASPPLAVTVSGASLVRAAAASARLRLASRGLR